MENLISVIVCTYNQERTIGRTLDSILMQRCHVPFEIVIGEDCSTDHTRAVCEDYAARYPQIRLFCNEHNKGLVDNYFDCMLACRGQFIADCAGDDFWVDDQKLEKEVNLMEADDSITLVHTAWRSYNELTKVATDSPRQPFPYPKINGSAILEAVITQTRMPVVVLCTALYRASTILQAYYANTQLFRNKQWNCEDIQIVFFLAMNGYVAYLPDVTLHYSQGQETVSNSNDSRKQFLFQKQTAMLSHLLSETYQIKGKKVEQFFQRRSFALLMHAFRLRDRKLRADALACAREWKVRPTLPFRLVTAITSNDFLWSLALYLRKQLR